MGRDHDQGGLFEQGFNGMLVWQSRRNGIEWNDAEQLFGAGALVGQVVMHRRNVRLVLAF